MRKNDALGSTLAAFALAAIVALAGCGGSSGGQPAPTEAPAADETAAEEAATSETSAEDAEAALAGSGIALGELPSRTNEDVAGIYVLDNEGLPESMVSSYQFKKDGTFIMRMHGAGQDLDRTGTYEIRDDKVYVNVPAGGSGTITIQGQEMKVNALEWKDVEIKIEDDKLTKEATEENGKVTAHKVSRKEYKELVKKADALGPQKIEVGTPVSGDGFTLTVNSFEFRDEIYPSDTSGYYTYWQHEDDHDYLVADVSYTNEGTEYQVPGKATAALLSIGENNYAARIEVDGGSRTSSTYSIDPKDTGRVIVMASIPDAAREEIGEVRLTWVFPKDGKLLNYYFSNDNDSVRYILTM